MVDIFNLFLLYDPQNAHGQTTRAQPRPAIFIYLLISEWQKLTNTRFHRNLHDHPVLWKKYGRWTTSSVDCPGLKKKWVKYWLRRRHECSLCTLQCRLEVSWKRIVIFSSKLANANLCTLQKSAWHPVMSNDDFIIYVSQWWQVEDRMGRRMTAAEVNPNPAYRCSASDLEERHRKRLTITVVERLVKMLHLLATGLWLRLHSISSMITDIIEPILAVFLECFSNQVLRINSEVSHEARSRQLE